MLTCGHIWIIYNVITFVLWIMFYYKINVQNQIGIVPFSIIGFFIFYLLFFICLPVFTDLGNNQSLFSY